MKDYKYNYKSKEYTFSADDYIETALECLAKITKEDPSKIISRYAEKFDNNDIDTTVTLGLQEENKMINCTYKYSNIQPELNNNIVSKNLDKLSQNLVIKNDDIDNYSR